MVLKKNVISIFRSFQTLWQGPCPTFEHPVTQECFVSSLVEIVPVVLEKKMKMYKIYYDNDDWERTNFDQISSLESSALVS